MIYKTLKNDLQFGNIKKYLEDLQKAKNFEFLENNYDKGKLIQNLAEKEKILKEKFKNKANKITEKRLFKER